jgi:hypothetical protein
VGSVEVSAAALAEVVAVSTAAEAEAGANRR